MWIFIRRSTRFRSIFDPNSEYCIGSVQKVFTGTMLAGRILEGAQHPTPPYALDAPVKLWLPRQVQEAPSTERIWHVTLAELATHTSCLKRTVPHQNHGLYGRGGAPDPLQIIEWLDNGNWLSPCKVRESVNYSNWGSLTLGFAVAQPCNYVYDDALATFIYPDFGMTPQFTNTFTSTVCVKGYLDDEKKKEATGLANGIRSSIAEMTQFVGHYLYYNLRYEAGDHRNFAEREVHMALEPPLPGVALRARLVHPRLQ